MYYVSFPAHILASDCRIHVAVVACWAPPSPFKRSRNFTNSMDQKSGEYYSSGTQSGNTMWSTF